MGKLTRNVTPGLHQWKKSGRKEPAKNKKQDISKILDSINPKKKKSKFKKKKGPNGRCRICKGICHQALYYYCSTCSFEKGMCSMCGKKLLDLSNHNYKNV